MPEVTRKRRVIIESPFQGDIESHLNYARLAMLDSILMGEAPFVAHLLYTQVLNDSDEEERKLGIGMGDDWVRAADAVAFYVDLGMSPGMMKLWDKLYHYKDGLRVPFEMRRVNYHAVSSVIWSGSDTVQPVRDTPTVLRPGQCSDTREPIRRARLI